MMNAKRFLSRIYNIDKRLRALEYEMKLMERQLYDVKATDYSRDRVSSSNTTDVADIVIRINEAIEKRNKQWDKLIEVREEVYAVLEMVADNTLYTLLKERYANGRTWEHVTSLLGYSSRAYVSRDLHNKALKEISKILKHRTKKNIGM